MIGFETELNCIIAHVRVAFFCIRELNKYLHRVRTCFQIYLNFRLENKLHEIHRLPKGRLGPTHEIQGVVPKNVPRLGHDRVMWGGWVIVG